MSMMKLLAVLVVGVVVFAACGSDGVDANPADGPAAGACPETDPDCGDNPGSGDSPAIEPPRPGVPVAEVVATNIDGGFTVEGFYFGDDGGARLCELLMESFPPQCGGAQIPFDNAAGADLGELQSEQGVTWSNLPILVTGEVIDGVFVAQQ